MMKRRSVAFVAFLLLVSVAWAATTYNYEGVTSGGANLDPIETSINAAGFSASLDGLSWEQKDATLHVTFSDSLDAGEKSTLDTIISTNTNWAP